MGVLEADADGVAAGDAAGEQRHRVVDVVEVEHLAGDDVGAHVTRFDQRDRRRHRRGREPGAAEQLEALQHDVVGDQSRDLGEVLQPGHEDAPTAAGEVDGHRDRRGRGGHVEDDVGAHAAGEVVDDLVRVLDVDHHHVRRADLLGRVEPQAVVRRTGDDHLARLLRQHRLQDRQALVAGPLHDDGLLLAHTDDVDPVHRARQRLEQGEVLGRRRARHRVELGAREDLHVLAVATPQPDLAVAAHVGVAVEPQWSRRHQDLVHRDPVALFHAELRVGRELHHPPHGLVAGHDGERARTGHELDALVLRHVAAAQTDRFDLEHRAARRRVGGHRELAHLVGVVAEEHRSAAGIGHRISSGSADSTMPSARNFASVVGVEVELSEHAVVVGAGLG